MSRMRTLAAAAAIATLAVLIPSVAQAGPPSSNTSLSQQNLWWGG